MRLEDPHLASWISKISSASKARRKICIEDVDTANMGANALKSHTTGDAKRTRKK